MAEVGYGDEADTLCPSIEVTPKFKSVQMQYNSTEINIFLSTLITIYI